MLTYGLPVVYPPMLIRGLLISLPTWDFAKGHKLGRI